MIDISLTTVTQNQLKALLSQTLNNDFITYEKSKFKTEIEKLITLVKANSSQSFQNSCECQSVQTSPNYGILIDFYKILNAEIESYTPSLTYQGQNVNSQINFTDSDGSIFYSNNISISSNGAKILNTGMRTRDILQRISAYIHGNSLPNNAAELKLIQLVFSYRKPNHFANIQYSNTLFSATYTPDTATASSTSSLPSITSISPQSGPVGTVITLTGSGFQTNSTYTPTVVYYLNGWPSLYVSIINVNSDGTQITITNPIPNNSEYGDYTLYYILSAPNSSTEGRTLISQSNGENFTITTVEPFPTVTLMSPIRASVEEFAAGVTFTFTGTNLPSSTNSIYLDLYDHITQTNLEGTIISSSATTIIATVTATVIARQIYIPILDVPVSSVPNALSAPPYPFLPVPAIDSIYVTA